MRQRLGILVILMAMTVCTVVASDRYAVTAAKAQRSFEGREWASAAALYELMLDMQPDSAEVYAHAIVANDMMADTIASVELLERAMSHGIGFVQVLEQVRITDFAIGSGDLYGEYLDRLWRQFPWMRRALDHELLRHYTFRHDGPMMVRYAQTMLLGLPDSVEYMRLLAQGYMFSGDYPKAVATWTDILDRYPDDYETLLYLGNYYADSETEHKLAIKYLSKAQALHPTPYVAALLANLNELTNNPTLK